ncbi:MAG: GIY-YIG nuclease family protein [Bacteroidales bacterium]|nr:GIY-YIG nuclease family protein [Bacteroidales bacterium]
MHYVYILKCNNDTYYTGCTSNLKNRIERHNKGQVHYTKDKLPVKLITYTAFSDKYKAYEFEKYLKSGSGIAFRNKRLI